MLLWALLASNTGNGRLLELSLPPRYALTIPELFDNDTLQAEIAPLFRRTDVWA